MTDTERSDDSGSLQLPFALGGSESQTTSTPSGRSRLSERRLPDPDAAVGTSWGQRAARLAGARHRPGHTVARPTTGPVRSGGPNAVSGPSGETTVATAGAPPAPPDDAPPEAGRVRPARSLRPPRRETPSKDSSDDPAEASAEIAAPIDDGDGGTMSLSARTGAWATAVAGRMSRSRAPKATPALADDGDGDGDGGMVRSRLGPPPGTGLRTPGLPGGADPPGSARPGARRARRPPDLTALEEMRVQGKVGRTPDWMARQIVEGEAPGSAYELGKARRWRRRKITVLRSRTNRRLVRRIDTWTVFKVSFMFYLLMVIIVLIAGVATWNVAEHLGFITDIQKSVRSLADDKSFVIHGRDALRWGAVGGAALGLLGTLFNTVAAMLYNLLSDVIGGLQVIVVTEPD